jgi:hypothetical protein
MPVISEQYSCSLEGGLDDPFAEVAYIVGISLTPIVTVAERQRRRLQPDPQPDEQPHDDATAAPGLVVMPKADASKLNREQAEYKELIDARLPLTVVGMAINPKYASCAARDFKTSD